MMIYEYANEKHIVDEFIAYTAMKPIKVNNREIRFFVWGYELWLPEGGKSGYAGSVDLIATDELGRVWLIEAKQSGNPELNPQIWTHQILNYRRALARRSHEEISMKARRYLLNRGSAATDSNDRYRPCSSLYEAFKIWAVDNVNREEHATFMYNQTLQCIAEERVIATVLADQYRSEIWQNRPQDHHSYAYIATKGIGAELELAVILEEQTNEKRTDYSYSDDAMSWSDIAREKRKVKPSPTTVDLYLTARAAELFKQSLQHLQDLGWNGRYKSNSKAFTVDLPTHYDADIRIHLGWVDFDGSYPIKNKLPGELGLKFNIDFRHFKSSGNSDVAEIGYSLARKLATAARYNGRGKGLNIQYRELTENEKQEWDWEMYRRIDKENRDYLGREDEAGDFNAAWDFLYEIIKKEDKELHV